jgi:hypothetical protein
MKTALPLVLALTLSAVLPALASADDPVTLEKRVLSLSAARSIVAAAEAEANVRRRCRTDHSAHAHGQRAGGERERRHRQGADCRDLSSPEP